MTCPLHRWSRPSRGSARVPLRVCPLGRAGDWVHGMTTKHGLMASASAKHSIATKALRVSFILIVALIVVIALSPRARAMCNRSLRSVHKGWKVLAGVAGWFAVSMSIIFTNKHLLTDRGFEFPFSLSCFTNAFVFALVFAATRPSALRPRPLPWTVVVRVVMPIGALTALDIGCSNWALLHLSVAFHTIIRGTVPAFVLCFSLLLGLDSPSLLVGVSVAMVCGGCALAAYSEVECDFFGLALALLSCVFSGLRWALTQMLVHRNPNAPNHKAAASSTLQQPSRRGSDRTKGAYATPLGASRRDGGASEALDKSSSPLSSMYYVTPACAVASGVAAVVMEASEVSASPYLTSHRLRVELYWYVAAVGALVFVLLFCEFGLVRLTSSLSLSVFGVFKELITIVLASQARGDAITPLNMAGFLLCAIGVLLYQMLRASAERAAKRGEVTPRRGGGGRADGSLPRRSPRTTGPAAALAPRLNLSSDSPAGPVGGGDDEAGVGSVAVDTDASAYTGGDGGGADETDGGSKQPGSRESTAPAGGVEDGGGESDEGGGGRSDEDGEEEEFDEGFQETPPAMRPREGGSAGPTPHSSSWSTSSFWSEIFFAERETERERAYAESEGGAAEHDAERESLKERA